MPPIGTVEECIERSRLLLGDEAVGLAAVHAGVSAAYAYPGTPSTEIVETVMALAAEHGRPVARWCANEKTAYEQALGASWAGRRALVAMKHVGLNVAADPFMNSALVAIRGGLVLAVADDPGMHSSQNEQDSRQYALFARIPYLEPADPQEAYDMTRAAFDLSERLRVPVMLRLVTRLAHGRSAVVTAPARDENPPSSARDTAGWVLLPANARRRWKHLLGIQAEILPLVEASPWNVLNAPAARRAPLAIVTAGAARDEFLEAAESLGLEFPHLHVGTWPLPANKVRALASHVETVLVFEQGHPVVESAVREFVPVGTRVNGRTTGDLPADGEITADVVRAALGAPARHAASPDVPKRPPQLCSGCPHRDAYVALSAALDGFPRPLVTSDIGCYTLGVLSPIGVGETCVCMGASIGMAKGAAEAGVHPVVAVIGDSTFLHSGLTALFDAVAADTDMTVVILDNGTTAMTGTQPTIAPSSRLHGAVVGAGVNPEHVVVLEAHPRLVPEMTVAIRREVEHQGLSVVICHRECIEAARRSKSGAVR